MQDRECLLDKMYVFGGGVAGPLRVCHKKKDFSGEKSTQNHLFLRIKIEKQWVILKNVVLLLVHAYHIISFLVRQKKAKKESKIFGCNK